MRTLGGRRFCHPTQQQEEESMREQQQFSASSILQRRNLKEVMGVKKVMKKWQGND